jgi:hypothetical protein
LLQGPLKNLYTQTPVIIVEKKKPTYGKAVVDGKLRYVSASAISAFDPTSDGGCPSRWYFEKVEGRKTPETKSQAVGTEAHGQIEHYLKTGERTLGTVVEPGARFLPVPGSDLLIEETFGDWQQALTLRDAVMRGEVPEDAPAKVTATVCNIPVMGAMDLRHRRGEWVDTFGELRREENPDRTAEIVDWKTTKDIEKWGKRADELHLTVQMPLYAKATTIVWPDVDFVRISHGQFGTARREARKVSALLDRETIAWRFGEIESMVRSMQHAALEPSVSSVEKNTNACGSYGGCPHKSYCDRPMGSIKQLFQITGNKEKTEMSNGLWGDVTGATNGAANGVQAAAPTAPPAAPVLPQISDAQRLEIIAAEKARLHAETAPTAPPAGNSPVAKAQAKIMAGTLRLDDSGQVFDKENADNGWVMRQPTTAESIAFEEMAKIATPPAPPAPMHIGSINPPEAPGPNLVASASALPAHVIAEITDPTLKARTEAHAAAHAANAAATTADDKAEKAKSRCAGGGQRIVLSMDDAMAKKTICAVCKREMKLKPVKENGQWVATISGHLTSKSEPAAAAVPPAPPAPPAPTVLVAAPADVVPTAPPVPFSEMMQATPAAPPAPVQEAFVMSFATVPAAPVSTMAAIPPAPPAVVYSQAVSAPLSTNELLEQINAKLQIIIDRIRV